MDFEEDEQYSGESGGGCEGGDCILLIKAEWVATPLLPLFMRNIMNLMGKYAKMIVKMKTVEL